MKWWSKAFFWLVGAASLAAILFPVFAVSTGCACKKTTVLSQLKQLATGGLIYATDYDEKLPPARTWLDALHPYLKNERLASDPSLKTKSNNYGLAFFEALGLTTLVDIENPERVPFFFQSEIRRRNAAGWLDTLPLKPRQKDVHVFSFADSSAKAVKADRVWKNLAPPRMSR